MLKYFQRLLRALLGLPPAEGSASVAGNEGADRVRQHAGRRETVGPTITVQGWEQLPRRRLDAVQGLEIVGERSYIPMIRRLDPNPDADPWMQIPFEALLVPEPANPFDRNATAVCVLGIGPVGYVGKSDAGLMADLRAELIRDKSVGIVSAKLVGGWGEDDENGKTIPPGVVIFLPEDRGGASGDFAPRPREGWETWARVVVSGKNVKEHAAIGETAFQERLRALRRSGNDSFEGLLVPGPMQGDQKLEGFLICASTGPVGRSSSATTKRYAAMTACLKAQQRVGICEGLIIEDKGRLEVKFRLPAADEAEACLMAASF